MIAVLFCIHFPPFSLPLAPLVCAGGTALRRWMSPDPLSEKYYGISPYAFCNNSPMVLMDRDYAKKATSSLTKLTTATRSVM